MDVHRDAHLRALGIEARWLDATRAANADAYAGRCSAKTHYGLDAATTSDIERHAVQSVAVAAAWLAERFPHDGTVQIVFGRNAVCVVDARALLDHWHDMFMPGRDDVIVLHNTSRKVLFFVHENALEVGERDF